MADGPYNLPADGTSGGSPYGPYTPQDQQARAAEAALQARAAAAARPMPQSPTSDATIGGEQPMDTLQNLPEMQRQGWSNKVYHGILSALGGQYETQYIPTDTGVVRKQVASTPGQQWKRIISGALVGVGGAAAAGTQGPGGTMRGLGAGIQAGYGQRVAEDTRNQQQANTQFEQDQKAAMARAQTSMLAQQKLNLQWEQTRQQMVASQEEIKARNEFEKVIGSGGPGTRFVAHAPDLNAAIELTQKDPSLHDDHAGGFLQYNDHIDPRTGKHNGVDAYYVAPGVLDTKMPIEVSLQVPVTKDGKQTLEQHTIPSNSLSYRDFFNANNVLLSQQKDQAIIKHTEEEIKEMPGRTHAEIAAQSATARNLNAEARQKDVETDYLVSHGMLPGRESSKQEQETYWGPGGWNGMQKFLYSKDVEQANQTENMYQAFEKAYQDHLNGATTGAPGMVAFSDHIGSTFGNIKGGKMNKQLIEDHLGARSISDDAVAFLQKFTNGDKLSPKQWDGFRNTVQQARSTQWDSVARQAKAQSRPMERIGFPDDISKQYVTAPQIFPGGGQAGGGADNTHVVSNDMPVSASAPVGAVKRNFGSDGKEYWLDKDSKPMALTGQRKPPTPSAAK